MNHNQTIGHWGEALAIDFLQEHGYTIVARNYRTPFGEIDIIAQVDNITIFVEVKARTSRIFGLPEDALTHRKLVRMQACATHYAAIYQIDNWQCDAIAIEGKPGSKAEIEHFENVTA